RHKHETIRPPERPEDYQTQNPPRFNHRTIHVPHQLTPQAQQPAQKQNNNRQAMVALLEEQNGFDEIINDLERKFSTDDVETRDGLTRHWMNYNCEGFPLIATRTKLTQMQSDVVNT